MRRITPEKVSAAYKITGLSPVQHRWVGSQCACALSACMIADGVATVNAIADADENGTAHHFAANRLGLPESYVRAFTTGFDNIGNRDGRMDRDGYADGEAAALALFGAAT